MTLLSMLPKISTEKIRAVLCDVTGSRVHRGRKCSANTEMTILADMKKIEIRCVNSRYAIRKDSVCLADTNSVKRGKAAFAPDDTSALSLPATVLPAH